MRLAGLNHEVEGALLEADSHGHQQDHAERAQHLRDRVAQQDVVPRQLLGQVALDARLRVRQRVEHNAHADVDDDDQLDREHVAGGLSLEFLDRDALQLRVELLHKVELGHQVAEVDHCQNPIHRHDRLIRDAHAPDKEPHT